MLFGQLVDVFLKKRVRDWNGKGRGKKDVL
jgi:hypothetical protein